MKSIVSSETLLINDKEFTLIGVTASPGSFGICDTTTCKEKGIRETFHIGHEPLINIIQRSINDQYSNKILWQISSIERCGDFSRRANTACNDYFLNNKTVLSALQPLLDYIKNGLYIIYESDMFPTDGAGNFFWSSYMVSHELSGSGTFNPICRKERPLPPTFLVPTENIGNYSDKQIIAAQENVQNNDCAYGLCFHLSGMFCALLSNHHEVTAALMADKKIHCLVIEPVRNLRLASEFAEYRSGDEEEQAVPQNCLYTCCANIPFSKVSQNMLETFFLTRSREIGKYSESIIAAGDRPSTLKAKRALPAEILTKCDKIPDSEMLQSAAMVDSLSDEQLDALLRGETMLNDRYIINKNYYSSITVAFSYLQYKNFNKFLDFAESLLKNEDLTAVHQYAASRLQPIMNEKIYSIFKEIKEDDNNPVYAPIIPLAEKYIKRYELHLQETSNSKEKPMSLRAPLKRNLENEINSLEMAKKIQSATSNSKR